MKSYLPLLGLLVCLGLASCHSTRRPRVSKTVPLAAALSDVELGSAPQAKPSPAPEAPVAAPEPPVAAPAATPVTPIAPPEAAPKAPVAEQLAADEAKEEKPGFFHRLFHWKKDEPTPQPQVTPQPTTVTPTPQQQEAAHQVLQTNAEPEPVTEEPTETAAAPELSTGGLRLRRFAPPEEATSSAEGTSDAAPNSAELHGLRSPGLRGGALPMDINGKLTKPAADGETQDASDNKES